MRMKFAAKPIQHYPPHQQCENFEHGLRFDKVTDSYKVGTFLRHSVHTYTVPYGR